MPQVAVITGASAGVGRACARVFAGAGYDVALLARGDAGLEAAAKEVDSAGRRSLALKVDTADADALDEAAARIEQELGPIEVWVNNAMTTVFAPFTDIEAEEFRRVTEVTYLGFVYGTNAALSRMLPRDHGAIVQVGSALAYRGIPLQSAYCGAKHAVQGFTESLRCELLHRRSGVNVTMVQMPALNTPQFSWVLSRLPKRAQPVPPIYQPEVAARAVLYAARHPRRREYWVGGSTAATLIANALLPGVLDRYLGRTGFSSQQTAQPENSGRPANLWEPVDEATDFGPHGEFDDRAHARSAQWWCTTHREATLSIAVAGAVAARVVRSRGRSRRRR